MLMSWQMWSDPGGFGIVDLVDWLAADGLVTNNVIVGIVNLKGERWEEDKGAVAFLSIDTTARLAAVFPKGVQMCTKVGNVECIPH